MPITATSCTHRQAYCLQAWKRLPVARKGFSIVAAPREDRACQEEVVVCRHMAGTRGTSAAGCGTSTEVAARTPLHACGGRVPGARHLDRVGTPAGYAVCSSTGLDRHKRPCRWTDRIAALRRQSRLAPNTRRRRNRERAYRGSGSGRTTETPTSAGKQRRNTHRLHDAWKANATCEAAALEARLSDTDLPQSRDTQTNHAQRQAIELGPSFAGKF
jgi:hypothetical protein